ncbi:MBL fold metallo-hydrolase [Limibaculum sp. M0105]|uniref:MBL fold metallo-hydrolase n=1 Tax=Thermohalobaculum xanthum TaxID=2753746 RepID=A0A8J7M8U2_9RHOB|nr:MBL fold metallo-hydrolase [Thermohalobaculum xanthum]MBK0400759.1 MBL fold metallo-hydrolase [Thermohalobaculum xanthum]
MTAPAAAARAGGIRHPWPDPPAAGEITEIAPGILWARLPLPMALDHVNVYALDDADGWTLVDTGLDWSRGRAAMAALRSGPLGGRRVARVILTHHHPDHVGLAGPLAEEGAEILATRVAWLTGRMLTLDRQERPTAAQIAFRRRAGVTGAALEAYAAERPFNFADCVAPLPLGYRRLTGESVIEAAGRAWRVHIGEGHAPQHATLWSEDGLVLAGDQILPGISPNIGVHPTEPDADPLAGWLESCRRFLALAEVADPLVLPGHGLPFMGAAFRLRQLIDNHEHALARILAALERRACTATELFPEIFKREIREREFGLALVEAVAHVNHLLHAGRVSRYADEDGAWRYRPA